MTTWTKPLPPKLPARVHVDHGNTLSWSGELRAVIDGDQLVIRVYRPGHGLRYFIETRWTWEQGSLMAGPLPRRKLTPRARPGAAGSPTGSTSSRPPARA